MKLICKSCSVEFNSDRSNKKYCSRKCYTSIQKGKIPKGFNSFGRKTKPKNQKSTTCLVCRSNFEYWAGRQNVKYCSKKCWSNRGSKINTCGYCQKPVKTFICEDKKYCNKECYSLQLSEDKKGENSPFWKGGISTENQIDRTRGVYKKWRKSVFDRDNYMCQKCNKSGAKITLNAHHIIHFAKDKSQRYNIDNGITLCIDCHRLEHSHKF